MSIPATNESNLTARLQRQISLYFAAGVFSVGALIALVAILPLYVELKSSAEQKLQLAAKTNAKIVEENIFRIKSVAQQVTSRTKARQILEAYNRGEVSADSFAATTRPILLDALNKTDSLRGITRLDAEGKQVVAVGEPISSDLWPVPDDDKEAVVLHGPVRIEDRRHLVVGAPILNREGQRVGTDITMFRLDVLQKVVSDHKGLPQSGEIILGDLHPEGVRVFFPLADGATSRHTVMDIEHPVARAMQKALQAQEGLVSAQIGNEEVVIAFGPVHGINWGILAKMDKSEMYASVREQIIYITAILVALILLGTLGMVALLRPLSGKIVLREDELRGQVDAQTEALEAELQERKRAEDAALQAADELVKSNEALEQFASVAAHDLKEPLRKVSMFGAHLQKSAKDKLSDSEQGYLEIMLSSTARMRSLIESLLTYTRTTSSEVRFEEIDLNVVVNDVLSDLNELIGDNQAVIDVASLPTIWGDYDQMRQLFQNLIANSIRYRNQDEPPHIQIRLEQETTDENTIQIVISDNGIGFDQEYANKIFRVFERLHSRAEYPGTGIGLSVCQRIVERHHGTINAEAEPGRGANFIVKLPRPS